MPHRPTATGASTANTGHGAKLVAPAATRNAPVLVDLLQKVAPRSGSALELASGTGQHIVAFARAMPELHWQPSEIDASRLASIAAYIAEAGLSNIASALALDATRAGWGRAQAGRNLITLTNLVHLISLGETETLIAEAADALAPGGVFVIYGPFLRSGVLTSPGDSQFHKSLVAQDPEIGYKDDQATLKMLRHAGLQISDVIELPANNLALIARKTHPTPRND